MCDKAVNTYDSTIKLASDWYKTQETCDKAVHKCFLAFVYIPDQHKTQMNVWESYFWRFSHASMLSR